MKTTIKILWTSLEICSQNKCAWFQYYGRWCPDDARGKCISRHNIGLVMKAYSDCSRKMVSIWKLYMLLLYINVTSVMCVRRQTVDLHTCGITCYRFTFIKTHMPGIDDRSSSSLYLSFVPHGAEFEICKWFYPTFYNGCNFYYF